MKNSWPHTRESTSRKCELQKIREGVLALMDKKLVPSPSTDESKAFYYKMKSDYYRYLAEFATDKTRSKAGEDACVAYAEATKIAENDLGLSSVVAQRQIPIDQTIEIPAVSLAGKVVEMPATRKTQQVANTLVQHDVNTVEVERPQIIKQTWQKPLIQKKINQVTKHVEVPLVQFLNKVDEIPVVAQRQVSQMQVVAETAEIPQLQAAEKIVETRETQTIQGIQTSESLVHLTGAMKPDGPNAKIKFFTEEALHGVGGFIFDAHGNRVASELGGQNCVTGEMWKNKPPFSLALNNAAPDDIAWPGRGIRKLHESGTALAEGTEAPVPKMPDSIEAHYQASLKTARNPNGEPYPASASEKPWNVASGKTVAHRQVPLIQRVQKMVEVPQVQFIDKVVDIPVFNEKRPEQAETRSLGQGEIASMRKMKLTRRSREASWSKWRQTWGPVAHTPRPRWTRDGTKSCGRSVG